MIQLDPRYCALVLIDLQKGILGIPGLAPHTAAEVETAGKALAARFRTAGAPVFLVHVGFGPDFAVAPPSSVDAPIQRPAGGLPADWSDFVEGLQQSGDIPVLKRQWGAFYGTELDLQLRRRGITTLVLGGIATNFGVESTARCAWEHGYQVVLAEDAATSVSAEMHDFAVTKIFPRISRVSRSDNITFTS
jgi:nicotinamidase-related amidase